MSEKMGHPGERLRREALPRLGSLNALAGRLGLSVGMTSELLHGRVSVNPALATRIAGMLGGEGVDYIAPAEEFDARQ